MKNKSKKLGKKILVASALTVLTTTPILPSLTVLSTAQAATTNPIYQTQTNPDLTKVDATLGADQAKFKTSSTTLSTDYAKFTASQTSLNDTSLQKLVLSDMDTQLTNLNQFISDLEKFIATTHGSVSYPLLTSELQTYVDNLKTYQTDLTKVQTELKAAIQTVVDYNSQAKAAYDKSLSDYKALNTAYTNLYALPTSATGGTYTDSSNKTTTSYISALSWFGWVNGRYTGYAHITNSQKIPATTSQEANWPKVTGGLSNYDTVTLPAYNDALAQYQASLKAYTSAYQTGGTYDSTAQSLLNSNTALYDGAVKAYGTANTSYTSAQAAYAKSLNWYNTTQASVDNGTVYGMLKDPYGVEVRLMQQWTAAQVMLNTDLTAPINNTVGAVGSKHPGQYTGLQDAALSEFVKATYPIVSKLPTIGNINFSNVGPWVSSWDPYGGFVNGWLYNYKDLVQKYGFDPYVTNFNVVGDTTFPPSPQVGLIDPTPGAPSSIFTNGIFPYRGYDLAWDKARTTSLPASSMEEVGFGLPVSHTWTGQITSVADGSLISTVADPIPSYMDYPSLANINKGITELQSKYANQGFIGRDESTNLQVPVTSLMITNWRASLDYINKNWQSYYDTALQNLKTVQETYNSSAHTQADLDKLNTDYNTALTKANDAYSYIYGNYANRDAVKTETSFAADLATLTSDQLMKKYGYRYLLAAMTNLVNRGFTQTVSYTLQPGQQYNAAMDTLTAFGQNPTLGTAGTISLKPIAPTVLPPSPIEEPVKSVEPPTPPVYQILNFTASLPTPPDFTLSYEPPYAPKLPFTGTDGNQLLVSSLVGGSSVLVGAAIYWNKKRKNKQA